MITVVKLSSEGQEQIRYSAEVRARLLHGIVLEACWSLPRKELGYTTFEPSDRFVEYFYTDRWFNIFAIASADGQRKGWYCNIAAPALVSETRVEQEDLLLDVWVDPDGQYVILDEDEFAATSLTKDQRDGARRGLQELLNVLQTRQHPFEELAEM